MRLMLLIDWDGWSISSYKGVRIKDLDRNKEVWYSNSGDPVEDYNNCYKWAYSHKNVTHIKDHDVNELFILKSNKKFTFDQDGFMREYIQI